MTDRRGDCSVVGDYAADLACFDGERFRLRAREISHSQVASGGHEIARHAGTIAVPGVRLVGREFHIIDDPVRFQFAQLLAIDQVDVRSKRALHLNVQLQAAPFRSDARCGRIQFCESPPARRQCRCQF